MIYDRTGTNVSQGVGIFWVSFRPLFLHGNLPNLNLMTIDKRCEKVDIILYIKNLDTKAVHINKNH